jgi:RNA polymerase sigma-70 factor (family 1)
MMREQDLLKNLRSGDADAYRYIFSQYYEWLSNYILSLSGNRSLSEDIVQETLIAFYEKRNRLIVTTSLKNYLFRSCHNQFLQHLRKQKITYNHLDTIRWEAIAEVQMDYLKEEDSKMNRLHLLIDQLPPRCRTIFIKNKLEKVKYKEIAIELGISIKTVENQMSKALHFLRENATSFLL